MMESEEVHYLKKLFSRSNWPWCP